MMEVSELINEVLFFVFVFLPRVYPRLLWLGRKKNYVFSPSFHPYTLHRTKHKTKIDVLRNSNPRNIHIKILYFNLKFDEKNRSI